MQVVVHKDTREFLSSYHGDELRPHHEVVEVENETFNTAISDCMRMGPQHSLAIFEDGRMSIQQGEPTPLQLEQAELAAFVTLEDPTLEQLTKALRLLIKLYGAA